MTAESLSTPSSVDPAFLSARFREMFDAKPRPVPSPRTRQSDRRAHRLQRRIRDAGGARLVVLDCGSPTPRPDDRRPLHQCGSDRVHSGRGGARTNRRVARLRRRRDRDAAGTARRDRCEPAAAQRGPGRRGAELVCRAGGLRCGRTAGSCRHLPRSHHHRAAVPASGERSGRRRGRHHGSIHRRAR